MMKSIVRVIHGLALVLVLAGLGSTFHLTANQTNQLSDSRAVVEKVPVPVCPPNDPNACGIDKW